MSANVLSLGPDDDHTQHLNTHDLLNANERDAGDDSRGQLPTVATPDESNGAGHADISDREAAAAAAEVSVMGQTSRVQRRDTTGEEAMIGATADGVGAFEMVDEVGELVKDRFLQFLME